jgi:hypothetical protein
MPNIRRELHGDFSRASNSSQAQSKAEKSQKEVLDDIWRKFVFNSDEIDDIGPTFKPSQSLGTQRQNDGVLAVRGKGFSPASPNFPIYAEHQSQNTPGLSGSRPLSHTPSTLSKAGSSSTDIPWEPPKKRASFKHFPKRDENTGLRAVNLCLSDPGPASGDSISLVASERAATSMAVVASPHSVLSKFADTSPLPRYT